MNDDAPRKDVPRGLEARITRRDLINGVLAGAGMSLLANSTDAGSPETAQRRWNGYGGVGDYANANGNTASVTEAAHRIRDGAYPPGADTGDPEGPYDIVIVGGGLAGLHAAYEIQRVEGRGRTCLLLENHPIFGGEARQNEFVVDGHRLTGPQGSNAFVVPREGYARAVWDEIGLPRTFEFAPAPKGAPSAPLDNFGPMFWQANRSPVGYFFRDPSNGDARWVVDPWRDGFARAPLPPALKRDLARLWNLRNPPHADADFPAWLDGMTYRSFLVDVLGLDARVTRFVDPLLAAANYGFGSDVISAYAAYYSWLPGVRAYLPGERPDSPDSPAMMSFPGGNTAIARALVKRMLPDAMDGPGTVERILHAPIHFPALDRERSWLRIRLGSTVFRVAHEGSPAQAALVSIAYARGDRIHRVRARSVVMASGAWVNRRILSDMPEAMSTALGEFHHGPMLVANVALRNWRFLDKLGFASARWFDGFGFFANIRRPMRIDGEAAPFHPDSPIVMTLYVPFMKPGHDIRTQGALARTELLSTSYRDFELRIRDQLSRLFGSAGFDPSRDIAGIVLNRWGHAYIAPQPGFLIGRSGARAPLEIVRQGYGRIFFGHSELAGAQSWPNAATEGSRAARQALAVLAVNARRTSSPPP